MGVLRAIACTALLVGCTGSISGGGPGAGPGSGDGDQPAIDPETGLPIAGDSAGDGDGDGDGDAPGDGDGDGEGPSDLELACEVLDVGLTPLRRLTRAEYNSTVTDLLGDTTSPADAFAPDEKLLGFNAGLNVSRLLVEQYMAAAESLARAATDDLPSVLGCDPAADGEDACVDEMLDGLGQRIYRRPLGSDEKTELQGLYTSAKTQYGFRTGVELLLQAMLQAPDFLYRVELGQDSSEPNVKQLTGYEIATRLSYLFHRTTPGQDLLDAAAAGELDTPEGIAVIAEELLGDDRARATIDSFHEQWLELDRLSALGKDSAVYPQFGDGLRSAMREETLRFAQHVLFDGEGTVRELLTAPYSFVNADLADLYGLTGSFDDAITRVAFSNDERRGLLTQASVLAVQAKANQSSPIHRGKFVRERLLCQQLSAPPADLVIVPPDPTPDSTTRERFADHSSVDACRGCHSLMDPIGFGFEHYDGIGRYRETDGELAVDASGELIATRDIDGEFDGVTELAEKLAQSTEVRDCVADQWFVYAFGRSASNKLDACSREQLQATLADDDAQISELLIALSKTPAFRHIRTELDEGAEP